jgi:hypothetical protein
MRGPHANCNGICLFCPRKLSICFCYRPNRALSLHAVSLHALSLHTDPWLLWAPVSKMNTYTAWCCSNKGRCHMAEAKGVHHQSQRKGGQTPQLACTDCTQSFLLVFSCLPCSPLSTRMDESCRGGAPLFRLFRWLTRGSTD